MNQTCKTCASTRFIAVQGKLVCQLCGSPYSDAGEFLIDTKAAMPILCDRGYQKLQAGEYPLAELIFDHMLEIDSNSFMAEFGKALAMSYMYTMSKDQEEKTALWDFWRKVRVRFSDTTPEERNLVKKYCEPLRIDSILNKEGYNLLMYAVMIEMVDLVKFLLDCGFDSNYEVMTCTDCRYSALFGAATTKRYTPARGEIIALLLKYGASPYILTSDGCGVINSKTLPEIARIIRQYYPDVKCIDGRVSKPKSTVKTAPVLARKPYSQKKSTTTNAHSNDGLGCLVIVLIAMIIGLFYSLSGH